MTKPSDGRGIEEKTADDWSESHARPDPDRGSVVADPDAIPAPLFVVDDAGQITTVNRSLADRLGYDPADLRGVPVDEVFPDVRVAALADHASERDGQLVARGVGPSGQARLAFSVGAHTVETDDTAEADGTAQTGTAAGRRYVCVGHDTDESATDRTFEQYERIVRTIDDGVYVLDDAFNITAVNEAATEMTGYDRSELVGSNATMLASEETLAQAAAATQALLAGESEAATISTTIETAEGETLPIETRFSVYPFADGSHGQIGVFRDVSDRIWYERALATLNDATRELLSLDTQREVCSLVVETVTAVIDLSAAVAYDFDSETNVLHPTVTSTAAEADDETVAATGDLPVVTATDGDIWDAFVEGERRVDTGGPPVLAGDAAPVSAACAVAIPLADHGVLWLAMDESDHRDPNTMELIDLVAASAEAALERVDRDRRLRERERELRDRNERLQRLERINEVIRRIDAALVGTESRSAVESAVTANLADSPLFSFAWVGRSDGDELVPTAWAGDHHHYLDSLDRSVSADCGPPAVEAATTGEVIAVAPIADDLHAEAWRTEAVSRGFGSALAVPIGPDDAVLTVYADLTTGFPDRVQCALCDLGETVTDARRAADAGSAADESGARANDSERPARSVELALRVWSPDSPLVRLSKRVGCRLSHEGTVAKADGESLTVVRPEDPDHGTIATVDAQLAGPRTVRAVDGDDDLYGIDLVAPTVVSTVVEAGGWTSEAVVDEEGVDLTVVVPTSVAVDRVLGALEARFGDVTVTASREAADATGPTTAFRAAARSQLTSRQWTVLRWAHLSGFFEWPRATTGEDVAAMLGVSQPTVSRHLRVGQGNLFDLLFGE